MQVSVFNEILLELNGIRKQKNRRILLIAPVHIILDETREKLDSKCGISSAKYHYRTSTMWRGIIHSFKCHYKVFLFRKDEMPEGGLTDEEIVDTVWNANKEEENVDEIDLFTPEKVSLAEAKRFINESIRFLYAEVGEELDCINRLNY